MKNIDEIISETFNKAFNLALKGINKNSFRHINESVFRYLFIKSLPENIDKEDEWKRIDLILHDKTGQYPIEFKFLDIRPLNKFNGQKPNYKGGPSKRNFNEFLKSCEILVNLDQNEKMKLLGANFKDKFVILVAGDRKNDRKKFADYYEEKYISTLNQKGILVNQIFKKQKKIEDLTVFGWIIKIEKKNTSQQL